MTESSGGMAWVYSQLSGIAGGRIYDSLAPENAPKASDGTTLDYIILQQQSYVEAGTGIDGTLGMGNMLVTVKAVTQSAGYASAEALLAQAHAALQSRSGSAQGVSVQSCVRDSIVRYVEMKNGIRFNHLGGIYRLFVTAQ